jgi:hypothetical protein
MQEQNYKKEEQDKINTERQKQLDKAKAIEIKQSD